MEVSGQIHAPPALPPGKELSVPIGQGAIWAPGPGLDAVAKRKVLSLPLPGMDPGLPSCSLVSVLT
jgi:hypothetical protein